jgi:glycosyltransferase involved in cell wall biosynthesis
LVPIEDPQAPSQAIVKLATSPELRARYGETATDLVLRKLSAKIIGDSVVRLYRDLTAANSAIAQPKSIKV